MRRLLSPAAIGQSFLDQGRSLGELVDLLAGALAGLGELAGPCGVYVRRTIVQQIYFTAVQAFWLVVAIGIALGVLVILPMLGFGLTDVELQARVIEVVLFHELTPLLTALVVIGRSGTALTAEIGEFQYGGVIDSLQMMGIDPQRFVVLPRIVGLTVSLVILSAWANLASVLGAGAYNALHGSASLGHFVSACAAELDLAGSLLTLLMVACYGAGIALVQCHLGLHSGNAVELQRNLPKAFVRSLLYCVGVTVLFVLVRR